MRTGSRALSLELIADLYSTAAEETTLGPFARVLKRAIGVDTSAFVVADGQVADIGSTEGLDLATGPYTEYYHRLDPWQRGLAVAPLDAAVLGNEIIDERTLVKTEFYNDFARPGGMFRPMGGRIQLARDVFATIGAENLGAKRRLGEADRTRLQRVLPYAKRALQLRRHLQFAQSAASLPRAALDALDIGVAICDAAGRVRFANSAAEALARDGAGIALGGYGKPLTAQKPAESTALAALVHGAATGGPGGAVRLSSSDGFASLLVLVTPLPRAAGGAFMPGHAFIALRRAWEGVAFTQSALAALFGLSEAQASIAHSLFSGQSPEEIAAARGIKLTTLKTHLQGIYARTGAENQRDLIRLFAGVPPLRMGAKCEPGGQLAKAPHA